MKNDLTQSQHVVLSGCSGGGKSTLLLELARRGFSTVPEPGRRIVEQEIGVGGDALPWVNLRAFARRAFDMALCDLKNSDSAAGWIFFDRGLVDAAVALQHSAGGAAAIILGQSRHYYRKVFLTPPWREIFVEDGERRHSFVDAVSEYERLLEAYGEFGYQTILLPKVNVAERTDFLLDHLR